MKATIQWTVGVIRAGPEHENFGDPFNFVCSVIIAGEFVYICGAAGEFSKEAYRAVEALLKEHGIEHATWDKKNNKARVISK